MDMSRYRELFLSETREHLTQMSRLLISLEQTPADRDMIAALFREAHSIKGMAASMGYERMTALAHHLEDALDGFRRGDGVPVEQIDRLLAGLDLLEGLLEDLQADRPERDIGAFLGAPAGARSPVAGAAGADDLPLLQAVDGEDVPLLEPDGTAPEAVVAVPPTIPVGTVFQVTVELAEDACASAARCLLALREMERAGEVLSAAPTKETLRQGAACRRLQVWLRTVVPKARLEETLRALADVQEVSFVDDRRGSASRRGDDTGRSVRVRADLLDQVVNLSGELLTHRFMLQRVVAERNWGELDALLGLTTRLIDDLHHRSLQARLMRLESVTGRLPRIVRDLARNSGKQVDYSLVGGGVAIDRVILEELADPLVHLVRNAVDHGIVEQGEVTVAARREKDLVLVEVSDNGRGMDAAELRRQAVARGVLSAEQADLLADREALLLVCLPGFSTAREVTETSGRGVGMDVVKTAVEKLGGSLEIHATPGEGTCFQMRLPLSMAIIRILLVRCGELPLALPVTRVRRTLELPAAAVRKAERGDFFQLDGEEHELVRLCDLLDVAGHDDGEQLCVVLTETRGRCVGVQVDHFIGQREAFVKPLDFPLDRLPGVSGATIEADGGIVFIIDPAPLVEGRAAIVSH